MRDFIKIILVTSFLLSGINVVADNAIKQSFYPAFAGSGYNQTPVTSEDGWTYVNLAMEGSAEHCFNGSTALIQSGYSSVETQSAGYITSPEKQGGIGMVSFWCKAKSISYYMDFYELELQVSSDGDVFTSIADGMVRIPAGNTTDYQLISVIVNDPDASFLCLELRKQEDGYSYINIDELIITDAVAGGLPASVEVSAEIEGELNEKTAATIAIKGNHINGDLTFTFRSEEAFSLSDEKVVIPAEQFAGGMYELPVVFAPRQTYYSTDTLCVSGSGIPGLLVPVSGFAVEMTLGENFNSPELPAWTNTVNYKGWEIVNGYRTTTASLVYEGEGSLCFYSSLTSPWKLGGVGEVSFMYRAEQADKEIEYILSVSPDGNKWIEKDRIIITGTEYKNYLLPIHENDAKYVRLVNTDDNSSYSILIDLFIVSASGSSIATLTAENLVVETSETPYTFTIPLSFANITADLYLETDYTDFSLSENVIPFSQANGTFDLVIKYNPDHEVTYASCNLTVTGGGLYFPVVLPVSVYKVTDMLFADFDGEWGSSSTGNYVTDMGWTIVNGSRNDYNAFGGSAGCVALANDGAIISPPKSGGVGSIQFYANLSTSGAIPIVTVSVSGDGNSWEKKEDVECTAIGYKEYEVVIDDPSAKFVRLQMSSTSSFISFYIDNVLITRDGVGIPRIMQEEEVIFATLPGTKEVLDLPLKIENSTSDIQVKLNSGNVFSLATSVISPDDVKDGSYNLSVSFQPEAEGYFTDSIIFSGEDFRFDVIIPLKGYILSSSLYQDFSGSWVTLDANNALLDGWEVFMGNRTTYQADILVGTAALTLNTNSGGGGSLLSIPKTEGVGMVSFYYKMSSSTPVELKVLIYTSLSEAPVEAGVFEVTSTPDYALKEFIINDPDAKYVKIELTQQSTYSSVLIDNLTITANGQVLPGITAPENVFVFSYLPEKTSRSIELDVRALKSELKLSLLNGDKFELETTELLPANSEEKISYIVHCLFDETFSYCADTLVIESEDLLMPVYVTLEGHILQDNLYQDFNQEGWLPSEGTTIVDGWLMKTAMRQDVSQGNPMYVQEGEGVVRLTVSSAKNGSLRSPAKSGGINTISFYYLSTASLVFEVQGSADGEDWYPIDKITTPSIMSGYELYGKEVKDSEAKFIRIQTEIQSIAGRESYLYVDAIVADALPYVRRVRESDLIEITELPAIIDMEVAGYLESDAYLSMLETNSFFTIQEPVITPGELEDGKIRVVRLEVHSLPGGGTYSDALAVTSEEFDDPVYLPVFILYTPSTTEPVSETTTIIECGFEDGEDFDEWKQYDLDGRALMFYTSQPEGWFRIEDMDNNTVFGASSYFATPTVYPADDWLFSLPLEIPEGGNYVVSWDARSVHYLYPESYEIRVIEDGVLHELENGFDESLTLAEVSSILVDHSDVLLTISEEFSEWVNRSVNLNKYRGKNIRVVWRHTSVNMHTLYIDNFRYYSYVLDATFEQLPVSVYRRLPAFAFESFDPAVIASVTNGIDEALEGVQINITVNNPVGESLFTYIPELTSLPAYQSYEFELDRQELEKVMDKDHYYQIEVSADKGYSTTVQTELYNGIVVTDTIYAWDNGVVEGGVYSDSEGFRIGQKYPVTVDSYLNSVTFELTSGTTSTTVNLHIYELEKEERKLITSINSIKVTPNKTASYVVEIPGENLLLEAGKTYFVALEQKDGERLYLAKQSGYYENAAYYTTTNAIWLGVDKEHTLFIRLNAYQEKKIGNTMTGQQAGRITVELTKDGYLEIDGIVAHTLITLYNVEGQMVFNTLSQDSNERYPLDLPDGVYIVRVAEKSYKVIK